MTEQPPATDDGEVLQLGSEELDAAAEGGQDPNPEKTPAGQAEDDPRLVALQEKTEQLSSTLARVSSTVEQIATRLQPQDRPAHEADRTDTTQRFLEEIGDAASKETDPAKKQRVVGEHWDKRIEQKAKATATQTVEEVLAERERHQKVFEATKVAMVGELKKVGLGADYFELADREAAYLKNTNPGWFTTTPMDQQLPELAKRVRSQVDRIRGGKEAASKANEDLSRRHAGTIDTSRTTTTNPVTRKGGKAEDVPDETYAQQLKRANGELPIERGKRLLTHK